MPNNIDRDQVRQLVDDGATLIEVLPATEYEDEHLAGAINIPVADVGAEAPRRFARDQPVIVYCYDRQ